MGRTLTFKFYMRLARYARRLGWHDLAVRLGGKAARLSSRDWKANYVLGKNLLALGRAREAVHAFSVALTCRPTHAKTERLGVDAALAAGRLVDVIAAEVSAQGNDPWPLRRLCAALFRRGLLDAEARAVMLEGTTMRLCKMESVRAWAAKNGQQVAVAGDIEEIKQMWPPVLGPAGLVPAPARVERVHSNEPYVAELRHVRIFSKSDTMLTEDGSVLNDLPAHPVFGRIADLRGDRLILGQRADCFLIATMGREFPEHPGGIFLGGAGSVEFGHWVQELLMKLQFLAKHPDFARLPIIVDGGMPRSHFDYLRCLVPNELALLPGDSGLLCRRLLVAPTPTFHPLHVFKGDISRSEVGALSPAGLRFLRDGVLAHRGAKRLGRPRKLYLSRRNMRWRRVTNDAEIAKYLADRGFEIINIEQYGFVDQVDLFREAECIVAPEGSALLNVIFCDLSVKLIILAQRDFWHGYYGPLRALGYQQLWVLGDTAFEAKQADYSIPIERIARALEIQCGAS